MTKLRGKVRVENGTLFFTGVIFDGTQFQIQVSETEVFHDGEFDNNGEAVGWLKVDILGRQGEYVYISLPQPTLNYGKNISVHHYLLQSGHQSLKDFRPVIQNAKPSEEVVVDEPSEEVVVDEPSEEVVVDEPSEEVVVDEPSEEVVADEPSEEVVVDEPSEEVVADENFLEEDESV